MACLSRMDVLSIQKVFVCLAKKDKAELCSAVLLLSHRPAAALMVTVQSFREKRGNSEGGNQDAADLSQQSFFIPSASLVVAEVIFLWDIV